MKRFHLFLILIFFPFQNILIAQSFTRITITGRITDASTGKPLNYVNVFIANTTLGDVTDETGNYIIPNVPMGSYELIASMMGYEIQKKDLQIYDSKERTINFELKPRVLLGEEIKVTAKYPKEWKKNLKIFKRIFFGKKEIAKKCEFKNPEVLDFKYDRKSGQFKAISEGALVFINNALGYEVTIFLEEYYAELFKNDDIYIIDGKEQGKPQSLKKGLIRYKGIVHFKELIPKNEKQKKAWQKNRLIAYNGSQRHFFTSLINGSFKKEGFKFCGAKQPRHLTWGDYTLNLKELLKKSGNEYQYILSFPEFLKVIYTKETDEVGFELGMELLDAVPSMRGNYNAEVNLRMRCANQTTFISIIEGKEVLINTNGIVISSQMRFNTYGYWRWDSPAESLPEDYQPN